MKLNFTLKYPAYDDQLIRLHMLTRRACRTTLMHQRQTYAELSVLLTDDETLHRLNHDFRGKDKPTNVLSFPSGEKAYLGDIAVSLDTVARESQEQGKKPAHHLIHMLVHSILHLLGHDHEKEQDATHMEQKEIEILQRLGINNPYA